MTKQEEYAGGMLKYAGDAGFVALPEHPSRQEKPRIYRNLNDWHEAWVSVFEPLECIKLRPVMRSPERDALVRRRLRHCAQLALNDYQGELAIGEQQR